MNRTEQAVKKAINGSIEPLKGLHKNPDSTPIEVDLGIAVEGLNRGVVEVASEIDIDRVSRERFQTRVTGMLATVLGSVAAFLVIEIIKAI